MTAILQEKMLKITENLSKLKILYNVEKIGFFGSITRDDFSPKSDIDILVEFNKPIGLFKFLQLEHELWGIKLI